MAEHVFYTGANQTFPSGDKLVHGQQGEVMGPATSESHKGKGLSIRFPGNKGNVECWLTYTEPVPTGERCHHLPHSAGTTLLLSDCYGDCYLIAML